MSIGGAESGEARGPAATVFSTPSPHMLRILGTRTASKEEM